MPRKSMRSRSRSRRGGSWDDPSSWFGSKKPANPNMPPVADPNMSPPADSNIPPPPPPTSSSYGMGGKKGKRRRSMRGGDYSDNISLNNLASNAAPFSNGNTATAPYVGGRTRRRRHHRHNKSCKKSCRKH